jgi:hypothetical protein
MRFATLISFSAEALPRAASRAAPAAFAAARGAPARSVATATRGARMVFLGAPGAGKGS